MGPGGRVGKACRKQANNPTQGLVVSAVVSGGEHSRTAGAIWQTRHAQTVDVPSSTLGRCTTASMFASMVQSVDAVALKAIVMQVRLVLEAPRF